MVVYKEDPLIEKDSGMIHINDHPKRRMKQVMILAEGE
jgi:hypothetical protein